MTSPFIHHSSFHTYFSSFRVRCWVVVFYTIAILCVLPFFPDLWNYLGRSFPTAMKGAIKSFVPLLALFIAACSMMRAGNLSLYLRTAFILLAFGLLVYFFCDFPAERFHLAEYGLLTVLTFWCLRLRIKTQWIYPAVIIYSFFIGALDEGIQGLLPNRFGEFRDVSVNWISSLLALGLLPGKKKPGIYRNG